MERFDTIHSQTNAVDAVPALSGYPRRGVAGIAAGATVETAITPSRQRPGSYCESFLFATENDCHPAGYLLMVPSAPGPGPSGSSDRAMQAGADHAEQFAFGWDHFTVEVHGGLQPFEHQFLRDRPHRFELIQRLVHFLDPFEHRCESRPAVEAHGFHAHFERRRRITPTAVLGNHREHRA